MNSKFGSTQVMQINGAEG